MLFSATILSRKDPIGIIWHAHLGGKLGRKVACELDFASSVESIMNPEAPLAQRLQAQLLTGVARLYSGRVHFLLKDLKATRLNIGQKAFRPTVLDEKKRQEAPAEDDLDTDVDPKKTIDFHEFRLLPELVTDGNVELEAEELSSQSQSLFWISYDKDATVDRIPLSQGVDDGDAISVGDIIPDPKAGVPSQRSSQVSVPNEKRQNERGNEAGVLGSLLDNINLDLPADQMDPMTPLDASNRPELMDLMPEMDAFDHITPGSQVGQTPEIVQPNQEAAVKQTDQLLEMDHMEVDVVDPVVPGTDHPMNVGEVDEQPGNEPVNVPEEGVSARNAGRSDLPAGRNSVGGSSQVERYHGEARAPVIPLSRRVVVDIDRRTGKSATELSGSSIRKLIKHGCPDFTARKTKRRKNEVDTLPELDDGFLAIPMLMDGNGQFMGCSTLYKRLKKRSIQPVRRQTSQQTPEPQVQNAEPEKDDDPPAGPEIDTLQQDVAFEFEPPEVNEQALNGTPEFGDFNDGVEPVMPSPYLETEHVDTAAVLEMPNENGRESQPELSSTSSDQEGVQTEVVYKAIHAALHEEGNENVAVSQTDTNGNPHTGTGKIKLMDILAGKTRRGAARWYYECMVLNTEGRIELEQNEPEGDIFINASTKGKCDSDC